MPSAITNADLAQKISDLIDMWRTRELQMSAWISGAAGGGDHSNGTYPLSDYLGNVTYEPSPAQLASGVVGPVADSTAQAVASAASAVAASGSQSAAQTARDLALSYQTGAQAARDLSLSYRNQAADAAANALASAGSASGSTAAAATSEANAAASATAAAASAANLSTSVTAAAGSASAAATSAAAAATFNPANFLLLSGGTISGRLYLNAPSGASAMAWVQPGQGTDQKKWQMYANGLVLNLTSLNDAENVEHGILSVLRGTGMAVSSIALGNLTDLPAVNIQSRLMTVSFSNQTFSPTGASALLLDNAAASGQTPIDFHMNGVLTGRIRNDFAGNINYVSMASGAHNFFSGGDAGVGNVTFSVSADGHASLYPNIWHTSQVDLVPRMFFGLNATTYYNSATGHEWRTSTSTAIMSLSSGGFLGLAATGAGLGVGTLSGLGKLAVASTSGSFGGVAAWNSSSSIFGPNVGSGTGAALGLGYDASIDNAVIQALAPSVAWKGLTISASQILFAVNGATRSSMLYFVGGQGSGRVIVQNGGSAAGTAEGDITLIW